MKRLKLCEVEMTTARNCWDDDKLSHVKLGGVGDLCKKISPAENSPALTAEESTGTIAPDLFSQLQLISELNTQANEVIT